MKPLVIDTQKKAQRKLNAAKIAGIGLLSTLDAVDREDINPMYHFALETAVNALCDLSDTPFSITDKRNARQKRINELRKHND